MLCYAKVAVDADAFDLARWIVRHTEELGGTNCMLICREPLYDAFEIGHISVH